MYLNNHEEATLYWPWPFIAWCSRCWMLRSNVCRHCHRRQRFSLSVFFLDGNLLPKCSSTLDAIISGNRYRCTRRTLGPEYVVFCHVSIDTAHTIHWVFAIMTKLENNNKIASGVAKTSLLSFQVVACGETILAKKRFPFSPLENHWCPPQYWKPRNTFTTYDFFGWLFAVFPWYILHTVCLTVAPIPGNKNCGFAKIRRNF